ncbi:MAG: hypothetical protein R3315_12390 [Woeseiaceae bacterium]|nr:hypothetical protein [Woeseiaceae bacterium]
MRKSASIAIPLSLITLYYVACVGAIWFVVNYVPDLRHYFPIGGIDNFVDDSAEGFEPVYSGAVERLLTPAGPIRLLMACIGAFIAIVPVSWVYFITGRTKEIDQSFAQTIVIMPIVVTGIATIVVTSIALAFSLAGIVAAVRFRFALREPAHAMYIFAAIGIGLATGIGALGVAIVISAAFVYGTLVIWKLEYGKTMSGPFLAMLTRRDRAEEEF